MIDITNTSDAIKKGIEIGILHERKNPRADNLVPRINELKIAVLRGLEPLDICKRLDEIKDMV